VLIVVLFFAVVQRRDLLNSKSLSSHFQAKDAQEFMACCSNECAHIGESRITASDLMPLELEDWLSSSIVEEGATRNLFITNFGRGICGDYSENWRDQTDVVEALRFVFGAVAEILKIAVKGRIGFVELASVGEAVEAKAALEGTMVNGRAIFIRYTAEQFPKRDPGKLPHFAKKIRRKSDVIQSPANPSLASPNLIDYHHPLNKLAISSSNAMIPQATRKNKHDLTDSKEYIKHTPESSLHISNFGQEAIVDDLLDMFSPHCDIESVVMKGTYGKLLLLEFRAVRGLFVQIFDNEMCVILFSTFFLNVTSSFYQLPIPRRCDRREGICRQHAALREWMAD
jgi:hypothetical protein